MKILVLGDIHGRDCWTDIVANEPCDKVVFLGDYVSTHDNITEEQQINNLERILTYKIANPDKVILLRGNHDMQHLNYEWAKCSGYFKNVADHMVSIKDTFLENTQWIYQDENIIFSHAGISQVWLDDNSLTIDEINSKEPCELFGFTPDNIFDNYGISKTQPLTWIRPQVLCECNVKGYTQVVGHTPVKKIGDIYKATKYHEHIWLCDNLPNEYLVINDNEFIIKQTGIKEIILPNRYGDVNKLVLCQDGMFKLICNSTLSVTFNDDNSIYAVDPSGGPFMCVGSNINGYEIESIDEDKDTYYLKLKYE